jgi:hypothetical protein
VPRTDGKVLGHGRRGEPAQAEADDLAFARCEIMIRGELVEQRIDAEIAGRAPLHHEDAAAGGQRVARLQRFPVHHVLLVQRMHASARTGGYGTDHVLLRGTHLAAPDSVPEAGLALSVENHDGELAVVEVAAAVAREAARNVALVKTVDQRIDEADEGHLVRPELAVVHVKAERHPHAACCRKQHDELVIDLGRTVEVLEIDGAVLLEVHFNRGQNALTDLRAHQPQQRIDAIELLHVERFGLRGEGVVHQKLRFGKLRIAHGQLALAAEEPAQRSESHGIELARADGRRDLCKLFDEARQIARRFRHVRRARRGRGHQTGRDRHMEFQVSIFQLSHQS